MTTSLRARTFLLLLSLALFAGFLVGQIAPPFLVETTSAQVPEASAKGEAAPLPSDLSPEETRDIQVFRDAAPSVVYITTLEYRRRDFFSANVTEVPSGTGSGLIWDKDGHVVTNFHVIEHGQALSVTLADKSTWDAKVVGSSPNKDLAVLKIEAPAKLLTPIQVGSSQSLIVGQRVLAVGNPFGLDHTLTVGVVSALGREIQSPGGRLIRDVVQTDAAINPGNSGGPLLDSRGRMIGINSAIYSPSGANSGIGFAVPVDAVRRLVPQLIKTGRLLLPGIGVSLIPDSYVAGWGIEGAVIYKVDPSFPAGQAGIEGITQGPRGRLTLGDRIIAVDGKPIKNSGDLMTAFEEKGVGATVNLTVQRHQDKREVKLKLVGLEEE